MEIYNNIQDVCIKGDTVVTIGNFDGVHLGHQELIKRTVEIENEKGYKSLLLTFENHPCGFLNKNEIRLIMTREDKHTFVSEMGIKVFLSLQFDEYISGLEPEEFIDEILVKRLNAREIVVGYDFRFGKDRRGNVDTFKEASSVYGFNLNVVEAIQMDGERVSSSLIRKKISTGDVKEAQRLLGRPYYITGRVVHGKKFGRTMGFPTINLEIDENILLPKPGVYCTNVEIDENLHIAATNIGFNPTVDGNKLSLESHIIEYDKDIYGKKVKVIFVDRLRNETKFNSIEELKSQLKQDVENIKKLFTCRSRCDTIKDGE